MQCQYFVIAVYARILKWTSEGMSTSSSSEPYRKTYNAISPTTTIAETVRIDSTNLYDSGS